MQKSTYIMEKVEELAKLLLPLGISHITIYITGRLVAAHGQKVKCSKCPKLTRKDAKCQ